jgi:hypothetical protein
MVLDHILRPVTAESYLVLKTKVLFSTREEFDEQPLYRRVPQDRRVLLDETVVLDVDPKDLVHQYRAYEFEPCEISFRIPGESILYTWRLQQTGRLTRYYDRRRGDYRFLQEPLSSTHIQTPVPGSHLDTRRLGTSHDEYLCFENFQIEGTDELNPIRLFYKVVEDHKFELHSCTIVPQALLQLIAFKAARRYCGRSKGGIEIELSHFNDLSLKDG